MRCGPSCRRPARCCPRCRCLATSSSRSGAACMHLLCVCVRACRGCGSRPAALHIFSSWPAAILSPCLPACRLPAHLPAGPPVPCSELCSFLDIDGARGDITINKAVRALVAYEGRKEAGLEDLERIAPMVLNHRCVGGWGGVGEPSPEAVLSRPDVSTRLQSGPTGSARPPWTHSLTFFLSFPTASPLQAAQGPPGRD